MAQADDSIAKRIHELRQVFQVRAFRLFSIANFSSLTAIWLVRSVVAWLIWEMTHSKSWLGLAAFAELGPSVFISFYAGTLADRYDRITILGFGQTLQTAIALGLAVLMATGQMTVWWLLASLVAFSIMAGLMLPSRLSAAPALVGRERLATASAVISMTLNLTRFIGPLIAAPLLVSNWEALAFLIAAAGFAINALCLSRIGPVERAAASVARGSGAGAVGFAQVIRDLLSDPMLRTVLALQLVASLLVRPLIDMFPAFADLVFQRAEAGFGLLNAAVGMGAIIGAAWMVGAVADRRLRYHVLAGTAVFALSMIVFALLSQFWLALVVLLVFGMAMTTSGVAGMTYVQLHTPNERLGRAMSLYSVISRLAPAVGALCLGTLAEVSSLMFAALLFPVAALLAIAAGWLSLGKPARP